MCSCYPLFEKYQLINHSTPNIVPLTPSPSPKKFCFRRRFQALYFWRHSGKGQVKAKARIHEELKQQCRWEKLRLKVWAVEMAVDELY